MPREIPIGEARQILSRLAEQLDGDPEFGAITISRRGIPVLAVLSWDLYQSIVETLEILGDAELSKSLSKGINETEAERGIDWQDAKSRLKL